MVEEDKGQLLVGNTKNCGLKDLSATHTWEYTDLPLYQAIVSKHKVENYKSQVIGKEKMVS